LATLDRLIWPAQRTAPCAVPVTCAVLTAEQVIAIARKRENRALQYPATIHHRQQLSAPYIH